MKSLNCDANRVRDYLPLPPTPTSIAFPPDDFKIRQITDKCSIAKANITKFIGLSVNKLYVSKPSSTALANSGASRTSS